MLICSTVALLYFIPAALYAMYNNLTFINLKLFDPPTYFVLLQLRIAMTGVVFQLLFKQSLTRTQWLSILLLMFGCIIKQANLDAMSLSVTLSPAILLIIVLDAIVISNGSLMSYPGKGRCRCLPVFIMSTCSRGDPATCRS